MQRFPEAAFGFESEFELLWSHSTEFGATQPHPAREVPVETNPSSDIEVHFNSRRHLLKEDLPANNLTLQIVRQINAAKSELRIATTRVRLVPVLDALRAAGQRGVHVRVLLSQDDYHDLPARAAWILNQPNIELRIKFYNLKPGDYMTYQMHNKFMIVDDQALVTGSFNWSASSENSHIENLVILRGPMLASVLPKYSARFDMIWDRGRDQLPNFLQELRQDQALKITPHCSFHPISLSNEEVERLLSLAPHCAN
jgi:phosphatidylserine/phosphatidylglycerophosphate/cardiolipin synthase-like enzyme